MPVSMRTDQSALQAQINSLGERMERGFEELKTMMQGFEARVRTVEQKEAGCQPLVNIRLTALEQKTETITTEVKALNQTIVELRHTNKILTWLGGIAGSSLIVWLIAQFLGLL